MEQEKTKEKKTKESKPSGKWQWVKNWVWKYGGSLLMDEKEDGSALSLGRVAFWATFLPALWMWAPIGLAGSVEIPSSMVTVLLSTLGYNLGTKGVHVFRKKPDPLSKDGDVPCP